MRLDPDLMLRLLSQDMFSLELLTLTKISVIESETEKTASNLLFSTWLNVSKVVMFTSLVQATNQQCSLNAPRNLSKKFSPTQSTSKPVLSGGTQQANSNTLTPKTKWINTQTVSLVTSLTARTATFGGLVVAGSKCSV